MANASPCFLLNPELPYIILQDCFSKFAVIWIIECMTYHIIQNFKSLQYFKPQQNEKITHVGKEGK